MEGNLPQWMKQMWHSVSGAPLNSALRGRRQKVGKKMQFSCSRTYLYLHTARIIDLWLSIQNNFLIIILTFFCIEKAKPPECDSTHPGRGHGQKHPAPFGSTRHPILHPGWYVPHAPIDHKHWMLFSFIDMPWLLFWMFNLPFRVFLYPVFIFYFFVAGQPATYAEYFSLNRSTAELLVLKPISRDFYQRFTLIIKVSMQLSYVSICEGSHFLTWLSVDFPICFWDFQLQNDN